MANNLYVSDGSAEAALNALGALCNSGTIKIYDGTQPTNANTALGSQNLLVTLTFGSTAFASATATGGTASMTANSITSGTAGHSSTATWFRVFKSDGTTVVLDGSVGASGTYDLVLDNTSINSGQTVSATSFTVSLPEH